MIPAFHEPIMPSACLPARPADTESDQESAYAVAANDNYTGENTEGEQ